MEGFNPRKKIIKGVAVGMAVAGSLLMPKESTAQNNTKTAEVKNKTEVFDKTNDVEQYRNTYLEYMNHPSYKKRLAKEMFGDKELTKENIDSLNVEYIKRLTSVKNASITLDTKTIPPKSNTIINDTTVGTTPYDQGSYSDGVIQAGEGAMFHEISHSAERNGSFNVYNINYIENGFLDKYNSLIKNEIIDKDLQEKFCELKDSVHTRVVNYINDLKEKKLPIKNSSGDILDDYEIDRLLKDTSSSIYAVKNVFPSFIKLTKEEEDLEKRAVSDDTKVYKSKGYFRIPTEVKARINSLRVKAFKYYNYNLNKDFNINDFEKLKEDVQYKQLRFYLKISDEDINELSKYVADAGIPNNRAGNIV